MPERTALYEIHEKAGAVFEEEAGWIVPAHFGDPLAEYHQARAGAVLFDVSARGKVAVSGKDAASFLHNLSTNEIKNLPVGSGCEAFLTTGQAKIVAHALVFRVVAANDGEVFWLDLVPGEAAKVVAHLDRFLVSEQVEIADRTLEFGQLLLAGPNARDVLAKTLPGELLQPAGARLWTSQLGEDPPCTVRHNDLLGVDAFDVLCPATRLEDVWRRFSLQGVRNAGQRCYHTLRVEAGTPYYGLDIDETNLPQEVGHIERTVSFIKGCYIGQETIARIRTYGHVNRSLAGLKLSGQPACPRGAKIFHNAKEVGQVTTSVVSPLLGTAIALGYLRRGSQEPGTSIEVEDQGTRRPAQVVALPFVPRQT